MPLLLNPLTAFVLPRLTQNPNGFLIPTLLEFNPTPNFSLSGRKENKVTLFLAVLPLKTWFAITSVLPWPTPWALGCSWPSLWLWGEFRDLPTAVSKADSALRNTWLEEIVMSFPASKPGGRMRLDLLGLLKMVPGDSKFASVCHNIHHTARRCTLYLPCCFLLHLPSLTSQRKPFRRQAIYYAVFVRDTSSVLCLFKY